MSLDYPVNTAKLSWLW